MALQSGVGPPIFWISGFGDEISSMRCSIVPVGPDDYPMSEELAVEKTVRPGGKIKAPLVVKIRIDEQTTMKILAVKPNTLAMGTFCATLVEHGLKQWEKANEILNS
jgi:hypothetical protein